MSQPPIPTLMNCTHMRADAAAMRISAPHASASPPPYATPLIAAITGCWMRRRCGTRFAMCSCDRMPARAPARPEDLDDGPPLQARPGQQIAWLAITGTLAVFLVGWGMFGFYKQTTDPPANPLVVNVTGQQWLWTYSYPSLGVQSNVLELPVRRPVEFRVTSDDVLHGFVINGLGVAMDANPGMWATAPIITPTKLGNFTTRCVELCGLYHTYMWSRVEVVSASDFAAWVAANGGRLSATGARAGIS